ncbi:OmpA family protein [Parvicella tangerina]|nr:OmpA family protein [Parvicella tangerina]
MIRFTTSLLLILSFSFLFGQDQQVFSVYFESDKHEVSAAEKTRIFGETLPFLDSVEVVSIQIIGNTDAYSSNQYNQKLGLKRASAVKELLADFLPVTSTISSLGKSQPKYSNETAKGRRSNRRVDIIINYNKSPKCITSEEEKTAEPKNFENDTIITFPEGVEFHIKAETFFPNKIKDISFSTREVLSPYSIYQNGLSTMTADGRCLKSGGMIFTEAQVDGVPVKPNDSILVRIPASAIDTSMQLWDIEVVDGDTVWVESDIEMTFNEEEKYYEFKTSSMPSINVDVPVASTIASGIGGLIDLITKPFTDDNTTIKSRGRKFRECYLVSNDELIVLKGDLFKPRKSYFEPCLTDPNDILIAHVYKKNKDCFIVKPLGEIKLKTFFNRFVIRKRDLKDIKSLEDYNKEVDQVLSALSL